MTSSLRWKAKRGLCCFCVLAFFGASAGIQARAGAHPGPGQTSNLSAPTSRIPESCQTAEKAPKPVSDLLGTLASHPTAEGYNALGTLYGRAGDFPCAVAAFTAALSLNPQSSQTRYDLALALIENHEPARAVAELEIVIKQSPDSFTAQHALGLALQDLGRLDEAQREFEAALKINPRFVLSGYHLAQLLSSEKKYTAAIYHLKQGLAASPLPELAGQMKLALAVAYAQSEDYAAAIPVLEELAATQPRTPELHYDLGTAYAHRNDYPKAAEEFKLAIKLDSNYDAARLSLAKALMNLSAVEDALPYAQEYIRRKPEDAEGWEVLGETLKDAGRPEEAATTLRRAVELDPASYKARYNLGGVLARTGRDPEAIAEFEAAKKLKPDGTEALYQLGLLLAKKKSTAAAEKNLIAFQQIKVDADRRTKAGALVNRGNDQLGQGRVGEAAESYRAALRLTPNDAKTHFNLSVALAQQGDREGEQRALEQAVRLDPKYAQAHHQLGMSYLAAGKTADAEREFKAAIESEPGYAEAENDLGVLYGREGRDAEAESMFRRAVADNPQNAQAVLNLGLTMASRGLLRDAVEQFSRAIELKPDFKDAQTALGMALGKLGRVKEAVQTFRKIVALDPSSSLAHLNLGIALADEFDKQAALAEFNEAIRLAPDAPMAHFNKGRLLYDIGRRQDARSEFEAARRLSPDYPDPLYFLALVERQSNNISRSAEVLEHLVKIQPQNSDAQYLLGQDLLHLGKSDSAIEHWKTAVETNPNNASALYNLARVLQQSGRPEAKLYQDRLAVFEQKQQLTDRVQQLGNFSLEAAKAGNWPLAIEQSREALQLCGECPQSAGLHRNLGLMYCQKGDLEMGERELDTALKIKPDDADALRTLEVLARLKSKPKTAN